MKKIFSILLALGLVLGMVVAAVPAAAQPPPWGTDWTVVDVSVNASDCEFRVGTYYIEFDTNSTLTQGFHSITVKFPEGTGYPATWRNDHIRIEHDDGSNYVFAAEITRDGDEVTFLVPVTIPAGDVTIVFQPAGPSQTGIVNPEGGDYFLYLKTSRDTMGTWVKSGWGFGALGWTFYPYTIKPTVSEYAWTIDFNPAYPGIAKGFIPPFKACGQNPNAEYNLESDWPFESFAGEGDHWVTPFNLALVAKTEGCQPCPSMFAYLELTGRPAGGVASVYNATSEELLWQFPTDDVEFALSGVVELPPVPGDDWDWDLGLHFSTVGTYTFDLVLFSLAGVCDIGCETVIEPLEFVVHQQKDAFAIPLYEKWNLISLPLVPFDSDINAMVASAGPVIGATLMSIWHYDAFDKEWLVYGGGQDSLTEIVDGKSYWFRLYYPMANFGLGVGPYYWWVFGTEKPQPPMGPLEYPVAKGWNMAGFTSLLPMDIDVYLWNWNMAPYPVIYGWEQGAWTAQGWDLLDFSADDLIPGQGYWMAFPEAGYIYVPTP